MLNYNVFRDFRVRNLKFDLTDTYKTWIFAQNTLKKKNLNVKLYKKVVKLCDTLGLKTFAW